METTVAKKLENLLRLQAIDSKIDEIRKVKGDLPQEVQDLEDEIEGYKTRISKFQAEKKELETQITHQEHSIKDFQRLIKKCEDQQANVRNNREYEAISREIEDQELSIKLAQKAIREFKDKITLKESQISDINKHLDDRNKDLANKKKELDVIIAESIEDEEKLLKEREKRVKAVDERLYTAYMRIRTNMVNGLAVVMVQRDACGGCFAIVPPQRQVDIGDQKKIIVCEHCGRIFAGVEENIQVPQEKVKKAPAKRKTASATEGASTTEEEL